MTIQATTLYPFVPSGPSFPLALGFFGALGFTVEWQYEGIAGLRFGGAYFILQEADIPEWQTNQMVTFEVTDLEAYWHELDAKQLEAAFPGCLMRPPKDFPWGREMHLTDPGGVCWHVRQSGPSTP
ncbi:MAG: bleomycin resistance protein [bacterium]